MKLSRAISAGFRGIGKRFESLESTIERGRRSLYLARQLAGRGEDGQLMSESFAASCRAELGCPITFIVTAVMPGGAAQTFYGLREDDQIVAITTQAGLEKLDGPSILNDPEVAKMSVQSAFAASWPIEVVRDGQRVKLPLAK